MKMSDAPASELRSTGASGVAPGEQKKPQTAADLVLRGLLRTIRLGPVLVLIVLFAAFTALNPVFLSVGNITDLVVQSTPILIIALGQLIALISQGIDLSVGSVAAFVSIAGWMLWNTFQLDGVTTIILMLLMGAGWGFVNGFVLVKLRIGNPFIVTLGSFYAVAGLALVLSGGQPKSGQADLVVFLGSGYLPLPFGLHLPMPVIVAVVVTVVVALFLSRARWGRWMYAVGANAEGAARAGIPVNSIKISVYVISGLLAAVASVVVSGRIAGGDANTGSGYELLSVAAVIIGGGSLFGGRGTIWNAVVGALIVIGIRNGLNLTGLDSNYLPVVVGAVLVAAVGVDVARRSVESTLRRRQARRAEGI
jgi:ribose transport system permease protein